MVSGLPQPLLPGLHTDGSTNTALHCSFKQRQFTEVPVKNDALGMLKQQGEPRPARGTGPQWDKHCARVPKSLGASHDSAHPIRETTWYICKQEALHPIPAQHSMRFFFLLAISLLATHSAALYL